MTASGRVTTVLSSLDRQRGTLDFNKDLSQRRAAAVVQALTSKFAVDPKRLTPFGVSFASPVASNKTEDGRAKNRRVQLVENVAAAVR